MLVVLALKAPMSWAALSQRSAFRLLTLAFLQPANMHAPCIRDLATVTICILVAPFDERFSWRGCFNTSFWIRISSTSHNNVLTQRIDEILIALVEFHIGYKLRTDENGEQLEKRKRNRKVKYIYIKKSKFAACVQLKKRNECNRLVYSHHGWAPPPGSAQASEPAGGQTGTCWGPSEHGRCIYIEKCHSFSLVN